MREIEILLIGLLHIGAAVILFNFIHDRCLTKRKTLIYFIFPLWLIFLGFYYLRCFIDGTYEGVYWRLFRVYETITAAFVFIFLYLINKKKWR